MSPTARSLAQLKRLGYHARVVEKWNPFAQVRQDVFGADVLALKAGEPILAVQCTTATNRAARRRKLQTAGFDALWKGVGASLEIWSWAKRGSRGQPKRWHLTREAL